jgi:opacity protein-like surface antigen
MRHPAYIPPPPVLWTGLYGGLNIGGAAQVGCNYQFGPSFVLGVGADFQGSSIQAGSASFRAAFPRPYAAKNIAVALTASAGNVGLPWLGMLRGRVGYLLAATLLLHGAGGFAYGDAVAFGNSATVTGWTGGGAALSGRSCRTRLRAWSAFTPSSTAASSTTAAGAGAGDCRAILGSISCART